jgi:putative acetyltransferase
MYTGQRWAALEGIVEHCNNITRPESPVLFEFLRGMAQSEITIRIETPEDFRVSEEVTRDAFWNLHNPGCDEHYLLNKMRSHPDYISELAFVAVANDKIVGHICYSKSKIVEHSEAVVDTITFGPISVLPDFQKKGVGKKLIEHSFEVATRMGYPAVIIFGDPRYYGRHGFRWAERYNIRTSGGKYSAALLIYVLQDSAAELFRRLVVGTFSESNLFEQDLAAGLDDFDASFHPRQKEVTKSQLEFEVLRTVGYFPKV